MNVDARRLIHLMRLLLFISFSLFLSILAAVSRAQVQPIQVAQGSGTLTAPGYYKQAYVISNIDTTQFAYGGTLQIKITMGSGVSSGSFDLFPQGTPIPTVGQPTGTLGGAYDISPGSTAQITYAFTKGAGQVFQFGATGNWFSQAGTTNSYSFTATVTPNPPPFTVTDVKLGLPRFETDPLGNAFFIESVYLKGIGHGAFSGHWVQNGLDYPTTGKTIKNSVDLSSGSWVQADTMSLPWDNVHNKSYTVAFSLDAPFAVQTDQLKATVTGFRPDRNGWKYQNTRGYIYFRGLQIIGQLDGLCLGMTSTASYYFSLGQPLPQTRFGFTDVQEAELQGQLYWNQVDVPRFLREGFNNGADFTASSLEGKIIQQKLKQSPSTICIISSDGNHAVLGNAGFSAASLVDDTNSQADTFNMEEVDDVNVFSFYDPNFVGQFRGLYIGTHQGHGKIWPFPNMGGFYGTSNGLASCGYNFITVH